MKGRYQVTVLEGIGSGAVALIHDTAYCWRTVRSFQGKKRGGRGGWIDPKLEADLIAGVMNRIDRTPQKGVSKTQVSVDT